MVAVHRLRKGLRGDPVCLEVQHGDAVLFHNGAVHDTLQQHPLPFQSIAVVPAAIQNGKLEFPQELSAQPQPPAQL